MKVTSKQADATLARLNTAMQRNTTLATGKGNIAPSSPVATYTPQPTVPPANKSASVRSASGIRLKPDDNAKIRAIIQAGLGLQVTLATSDAIRLALQAYDPQRLNSADIAQLRSRDGRSNPARLRTTSAF